SVFGRALLRSKAAAAQSSDVASGQAVHRHPARGKELRRDRFVRIAGRRGCPCCAAARALSRKREQGFRYSTGRHKTVADLHSKLGLRLAGYLPLRSTALAEKRHHSDDGVHLRQLGIESAEPADSSSARPLGAELVG